MNVAAMRRLALALLTALVSWGEWLTEPVMILLAAGAVTAQQSPPQVLRAYDVCSVKQSSGESSAFRSDPGGGFTTTGTTTAVLVASAFDVRDFQVFGLPSWATTELYDVACKDTVSNDVKPPISRIGSGIQALLADRFRLQYHRESRPLPVATLRIGKSGMKVAPSKGDVHRVGYGLTSIHAEGSSMGELAKIVTSLTHEKVIDKTGLTGFYDF